MIETITCPADIKSLTVDELTVLASEMRNTIIQTVAKNGGHLASNLGMVESTIALHRVFDSPSDHLVFDVGHQCYSHKLLTGRYANFSTLRQFGGLSGFENRTESEHDILSEGHCGTSVSSALGIAIADKLQGRENYTVAVVGDGAMTNGMIYEALNNCSDRNLNLIILINDNEMSISPNVGGLHNYFTNIRISKGYFNLKRRFETGLSKIPLIGRFLARACKAVKDFIKRIFISDTLFEDLGLIYLGPVDGHNIEKLTNVLNEAKNKHTACVVHMVTRKGYGYPFAEKSPDLYHSVGSFDPAVGAVSAHDENTFSNVFGRCLCDLAEEDPAVCAITAAMAEGTGLLPFAEKFPRRFFDVGIAEEHAVTFACGLSVSGMKPVVALYSTFSQRVYDQVLHDLAIQRLPMVLALDRCGLIPSDGITHQGIFDYSIFSAVPGSRIFAPCDGEELCNVLSDSVRKYDGLSVIRYPKGTATCSKDSWQTTDNPFVYSTPNVRDSSVVMITYGRFCNLARAVAEELESVCSTAVIKLLQVYPLDYKRIAELLSSCKVLYILDEGYRQGGLGEKLAANLETSAKIRVKAIEGFVEHGSVDDLFAACGFTVESVSEEIKQMLINE